MEAQITARFTTRLEDDMYKLAEPDSTYVLPMSQTLTQLNEFLLALLPEAPPDTSFNFRTQQYRILSSLGEALTVLGISSEIEIEIEYSLGWRNDGMRKVAEAPSSVVGIQRMNELNIAAVTSRGTFMVTEGAGGKPPIARLRLGSDSIKGLLLDHSTELEKGERAKPSPVLSNAGTVFQMECTSAVSPAKAHAQPFYIRSTSEFVGPHSGHVSACAMNSSSDTAAAGYSSGAIALYRLMIDFDSDEEEKPASGRKRKREVEDLNVQEPARIIEKAHKSQVTMVTFVDYKEQRFFGLLSASTDGKILLHDYIDGSLIGSWKAPTAITCGRLNEESMLATGHVDGRIRIWKLKVELGDPQKSSCVLVETYAAHARTVISMAWNPWAQNILASGANDGCVSIVDYTTKSLPLDLHKVPVEEHTKFDPKKEHGSLPTSLCWSGPRRLHIGTNSSLIFYTNYK